jgi:hypothetical protein
LTDVLACSQEVLHPGIRLVSAAIMAHHSHFPFWELIDAYWFLCVSTKFLTQS